MYSRSTEVCDTLRKFLLIEGVEAGGQNTGQPGATQEVGGEEQSPHQHRVEGKHRVNVEKDGLHPGLKYGESEIHGIYIW